jgi:hypothetical protein
MAYYRSLTLDHTQAGSADTANYPCLWRGNASLATVANGGRVTSSSGYDIVFCTDHTNPLGTKLAFERVMWSATTGLGEFHINVGTLTHSSSLVIYVYYGDGTITTDQQNVSGTWNAAYKSVYHFPATTGAVTTSNVVDSGSNGLTLNTVGGSPNIAAGLIGNAYSSTTTSDCVYRNSVTTYPEGASAMTASAWFKLASAPGSAPSGAAAPVGWGSNSTNGQFLIFLENSPVGGNFATQVSYGSWSWDTNWHNVVMVYPSGASSVANIILYIDGSSVTISNPGSGALNVANNARQIVGANAPNPSAFNFPGLIDEVRVINGAITASQVTADYNSQQASSTFISVGSETSTGGGSSLLINPGDTGGMQQLQGGCNA